MVLINQIGGLGMGTDNCTPHSAGDYDYNIFRTIPLYEHFHRQTIELISVLNPEPGIWLDTGCGTGQMIEKALPVFKDTRFVIADPSSDMLAIAADKLKPMGGGRIKILEPCGSSQIIWKDEEPPDVITAIQAHHYLDKDQRRQAIGNCYNILADGGILVCYENIAPFTETGVPAALEMVARFQTRAGKSRTEVDSHRIRYNRDYLPINIEQHLNLYREFGFEAVEMLWYSYLQAGFFCVKTNA